MNFKIIPIIILSLLLFSCNSNIREENTDEIIKEPTVEYKQFLKLFDDVSNNVIRQDGIIKITLLHNEYDNLDVLPLLKIVELFDELIKEHPLQRADMFLFKLSHEFDSSGYTSISLRYLNQLVTYYPDTQVYDLAQFRRGEILFSQHHFPHAEFAFKQVVDYKKDDKKSAYYEQSVYMLGQSQFQQGSYSLALNSFMYLLDLHTVNKQLNLHELQASERKFVKDIMHSINLCFSYKAGPTSLNLYFSGQNKRSYEHVIVESLARFYEEQNKIEDAVKTYRLFVSDNKVHFRSPGFLLEVINLYEQGGFPHLLSGARKDFVKRYSINNPYWSLYQSDQYESELAALKNNLTLLADFYHLQAKETKSDNDFFEAQYWYRAWLKSFPDDEKTWQINYSLAESLLENSQYELAALQFERLAYDYKKQARSADAGFISLQMYKEREKQLTGFIKKQWLRNFHEASIRFSKQFPDYSESIEIPSVIGVYADNKIEIANKYIALRDWQKAAVLLEEFRVENPAHTLIPFVVKQLSLIYLMQGNDERASVEFEGYAYIAENFYDKLNSHWMSAELADLSGDIKRAKYLYVNIAKRFPLPLERSIRVKQRLVDIYDRESNEKQVINWRIQLANADASGAKKRTKLTRLLAAKAIYDLAFPLLDSYRQASLIMPIDDSLKVKNSKMNQVIETYRRAVSYRVPVILSASTYNIAELYYDIFLAIKRSPKPDQMTEKQRDQYTKLLNDKALPFQMKAKEFHEINVARTADGIDDAWVGLSRLRLKEINMDTNILKKKL